MIVLKLPAEETPFAPTPSVLIEPVFVMTRVSLPLSGGLVGPCVVVTGPLIIVVSANANCGNEIANVHKAADLTARAVTLVKTALPIIRETF
jgi:hypothetical protein